MFVSFPSDPTPEFLLLTVPSCSATLLVKDDFGALSIEARNASISVNIRGRLKALLALHTVNIVALLRGHVPLC